MGADVSMALLDRPLYHIRDAAELLDVPASTLRYWLQGLTRGDKIYLPVLRQERNDDSYVTWGEFIEASLLEQLRRRGVKLDQIRQFARGVRLALGWKYPLARHDVLVGEDRELVYEAQRLADLPDRAQLLVAGPDYGKGQPLLAGEPLEAFLEPIDFDDEVHIPVAWRPDPDIPAVSCSPLRRFGAPQVGGVPTEALWELHAAGETVDGIATDFQLSEDLVRDAILFEKRRRAADEAA